MLLKEVYENANVVSSGSHFTTVNEFTDQIPALRPSVLWEAALEVVKAVDFSKATKIVTEEDKGAPLATAVSLITGLPLAMARWYPYDLSSASPITVDIQSEYFTGTLFLNGIEKDDNVVIVDDTISTGGALISLIEAINRSGATIEDVICVIEKDGNNGKERVKLATDMNVKTIQKIRVSKDKVEVLPR